MLRQGGTLFMALSLAAGLQANAWEYIPVYRGSVLGGQYFIGNTKASLSGNASLLAAPVISFNDKWSLLPVYSGNYRGTKGTNDGVAAGTLFQQQMDHRVSATGLYNLDGTNWRFKPGVSYKREFLKETLDETWGLGLFDYEKLGVGFEAENVYKDPFSYRFGLDFYRIRFPNYQALEANVGADPQGNPLGRELASKNVLDTYNYQFSFSMARPFPYEEPKVSLQVGVSSLMQSYIDQRLIDERGQPTNHRPYGRRDYQQNLGTSVTYPRDVKIGKTDCRLNSNFGLNVVYNGSNQNTFDAAQTKAVFDSYSYWGYGLGPNFSLVWGDSKRPTSVNLAASYGRTQYVGRLTQDANGTYVSSRQWQDRYSTTLAYNYPIAAGFYLKAQSNFLWATSNNAYQVTYLYTYRAANYLMGFTYEY